MFLRGTEDRLGDVTTDPDVDDSRDTWEDGPEETVAEGGDIRDDDVLQEEETGDTEDVDTVSNRVRIDIGRSTRDGPSDGVEHDAEEVALETTEVIGNFCDRRLRDSLCESGWRSGLRSSR